MLYVIAILLLLIVIMLTCILFTIKDIGGGIIPFVDLIRRNTRTINGLFTYAEKSIDWSLIRKPPHVYEENNYSENAMWSYVKREEVLSD